MLSSLFLSHLLVLTLKERFNLNILQFLMLFLKNRLPGAINYEAKQSALSLSSEIKAMEAELSKNKKLEDVDLCASKNPNQLRSCRCFRFNNSSLVSPNAATTENGMLDDFLEFLVASPPTSTTLTTNGYRLCPPRTQPGYAIDTSPTINIDTNDLLAVQDTTFGYNYDNNHSILPIITNGANLLCVLFLSIYMIQHPVP
ncbi:hypothetical protein P3X46_025494 [Hevea brasiliensis]|uniref:Uncharacterized protein n=1 Tax=Hevea brasiliensis TaxID=3981 RepID=A0ABQ9L6U5_HEVBR|nr:hypothetical protein P3X46_025494 [Hevea brasiliensis]